MFDASWPIPARDCARRHSSNTCAQVAFADGQAEFSLQSFKVDVALHEKVIDDLKTAHKTFADIKDDLALLPKGESAGLVQPGLHQTPACEHDTSWVQDSCRFGASVNSIS